MNNELAALGNIPVSMATYLKDVEHFLGEDLRMEMDEFLKMDVSIFERYAAVGKKATSIQTIIKYLKKR